MNALKSLKNNSALRPFYRLAKKHLYNRYQAARLHALPFPPEVWIENTNHCNAKCIMCPREQLTRPRGFMKFSLFEKLIKEIAQHREKVGRVHLHNYGEPLLDKGLPDRIKLAKDHGIKHLYFVTNASLLTPELSEKIIKAGLDEFKISFYGVDKQSYNKTMKQLDFDKTTRNIKDFFHIRNKMNASKPKVVIQYLPQDNDGPQKTANFSNIFTPLIDPDTGDSLNIFSLHNFGGGREFHKCQNREITGICHYPWHTTVILHDGSVALCCLDFNGLQIAGNVNENSIKEIWNGEAYRKIRSDFKKLRYENYPSCMKCNIIRE